VSAVQSNHEEEREDRVAKLYDELVEKKFIDTA
jgi:hypothetical protein